MLGALIGGMVGAGRPSGASPGMGVDNSMGYNYMVDQPGAPVAQGVPPMSTIPHDQGMGQGMGQINQALQTPGMAAAGGASPVAEPTPMTYDYTQGAVGIRDDLDYSNGMAMAEAMNAQKGIGGTYQYGAAGMPAGMPQAGAGYQYGDTQPIAGIGGQPGAMGLMSLPSQGPMRPGGF